MHIGLIGLGKMGFNMRERLRKGGVEVTGYDRNPDVTDAASVDDLIAAVPAPRIIWIMVPAGPVTDAVITELSGKLESGDLVIDGGNSRFTEDQKHGEVLSAKGIRFADCGVSGGVWGLQNGYGLMAGGDAEDIERALPVFDALRPEGERADSFVHVGGIGAGHYAKMVHNGIEYGLMQAYAEGLDILRNAGSQELPADLRFNLDLADVTELWRRGSVVSSWLLDLTAGALAQSPDLKEYTGFVQDSGEGRWTIEAAIAESVPAPVLAASLFERFRSRQDHTFGEKVLSAMRHAFGGHREPPKA
jgi:6-phosphogluconate dehydrogenase